jgi:hypothetical protein
MKIQNVPVLLHILAFAFVMTWPVTGLEWNSRAVVADGEIIA